MTDFLVRRDDLHQTRIEETEAPEVQDGEALLAVDSFGLTTNNITYALMGDAMNYWNFFPAEDGWGHMPVWGFGEVADTKADGVPEGTRVFGYFPPSSYLVVQPDRPSQTDFVDVSPHRVNLPAAYNRYIRTDGDDAYDADSEDLQMLLWPLYFTSFLIDDFIEDEDRFGAEALIVSSASSRTSSALGWLASRHDGLEVVGLTSPHNVEFTDSLGVYDKVVPYSEIESLEQKPSIYVDVAGDAKVRSAVHGRLADELKHSAAVGLTHREDLGGGHDLAGPKPVFFFAPDRLKKRTEDWGPEGLNKRIRETWREYANWVSGWLRVERAEGPKEIERIYLELLDGKTDPAVGHVVSP
jgi:hypothetical protein